MSRTTRRIGGAGAGGAWWMVGFLGPTGIVVVLALILGITLIVGASSTTATNSQNSDSSGGLCTYNGTTPATGPASGSAAVAVSAPTSTSTNAAGSGEAAVSAAVAQATGSLPATVLAAAQHVAGYNLSADQVRNAQIIVGVGKGLQIDARGMQVALVVAQTDSGLNPAASINTGQVVGMFHQLTTAYPGINLADPVTASEAFYRRLVDLAEYISPSVDVGQVAAAMQEPVAPLGLAATAQVYGDHVAWAKSLVTLLDTGPAAATGPAGPAFDCLTGQAAVAIPGLTPAQARNAQAIAAVGAARRLGAQAITIAVAVAIAESTLMNYANDGTSADYGYFSDGHRELDAAERAVARQSLAFAHDAVGHNLDSEGLFQQRPSAGWGTSAQLMDPATSAGKFYDQLVKVPNYSTGDPATIAQTVQGSNDSSGGIYAASYTQASTIVAALAKSPASGSVAGHGVVVVNGPQITLPAAAGIAGTITAPTPTVAKVIVAGLAWLGEPYSWGGGSPTGPTLGICGPGGAQNDCHVTGFDCSGLMMYMWAQVGINLTHFSQDQWAAGTQIPYSQALPGDMVGYNGHITMFIGTFGGVDYELEAPESGMSVRVTPVRNSPGDPHYATVSRVWAGH